MTLPRRPAAWRRAVALAAAVVVLGGCTISSAGPDDEESAERTSGTTEAGGDESSDARPSATATPTRDVAELSREVLAQAEADAADATVLGSVSGDERGDTVTLDVVSLQRTSDAVLLEFEMSSPTPDLNIGVSSFADARFNSVSFIKVLYLDDTAGGTRYLPLFFDDGRQGCVCPYLPLRLGPEPQTLFAMFPPVPDAVATVDVTLGGLVVPAVPID